MAGSVATNAAQMQWLQQQQSQMAFGKLLDKVQALEAQVQSGAAGKSGESDPSQQLQSLNSQIDAYENSGGADSEAKAQGEWLKQQIAEFGKQQAANKPATRPTTQPTTQPTTRPVGNGNGNAAAGVSASGQGVSVDHNAAGGAAFTLRVPFTSATLNLPSGR